jgi:hypothetical protein
MSLVADANQLRCYANPVAIPPYRAFDDIVDAEFAADLIDALRTPLSAVRQTGVVRTVIPEREPRNGSRDGVAFRRRFSPLPLQVRSESVEYSS